MDKVYNIPIEKGDFALSGQAINLINNFVIEPGQVSFTLTGFDTAFPITELLGIEKGDFVLTGHDIGLFRTFPTAIDKGDFILTGQDINLFTNKLLGINQGSFALSGQTVNFFKSLLLQPAKGDFVLTGFDTTLNVMAISDNIVITILETKKYINTKIGIENYIEQLIESKSFV